MSGVDLPAPGDEGAHPVALEHAERVRTQQSATTSAGSRVHAAEVEIHRRGRGARPYEFASRPASRYAHERLDRRRRSFPGNPYDGHTLAERLERTNDLLHDIGTKPRQPSLTSAFMVSMESARRCTSSIAASSSRWVRSNADGSTAPSDRAGHQSRQERPRMDRCWLQGAEGDALHAVLCAAGFNIRWLLRAIAAKGLKPLCWPSRNGRCGSDGWHRRCTSPMPLSRHRPGCSHRAASHAGGGKLKFAGPTI